MSALDKARNAVEKVVGQVKEQVGKRTSNEDLEAEGHKDQTQGNLKDAGKKDAFKE